MVLLIHLHYPQPHHQENHHQTSIHFQHTINDRLPLPPAPIPYTQTLIEKISFDADIDSSIH